MNEDGIDKGRRRFLTTAATVVGGAGVAAGAVPFISTMLPSDRTKALGAPVEVDISDLQPGELKRVEWQGKVVLILRRSKDTLDALSQLGEKLSDPESNNSVQPDYAKNEYRSVNDEYLIVQGWCTHLGCVPTYAPKGTDIDIENWQGGFFCPCHGSRFDLAGRVYKGVPAPDNLIVPPYQYLSSTRVLIGDDSGTAS